MTGPQASARPTASAPSNPGRGKAAAPPAAPATTPTFTPPPAAGVSQATTATPPPPPLLSALRLSRGAIVALHRVRRRIASVGFSFALSQAAQVTATLARGARAHGRWRYGRVASPQSFSARRG